VLEGRTGQPRQAHTLGGGFSFGGPTEGFREPELHPRRVATVAREGLAAGMGLRRRTSATPSRAIFSASSFVSRRPSGSRTSSLSRSTSTSTIVLSRPSTYRLGSTLPLPLGKKFAVGQVFACLGIESLCTQQLLYERREEPGLVVGAGPACLNQFSERLMTE